MPTKARSRTPRNKLNHLPKAVRSAREARELSQVEVAERVGISSGHLSEIESGTRNADDALLRRIARVVRCPVDQLRRRRDHQCLCGFGYDIVPLHLNGTGTWCPEGGEPLLVPHPLGRREVAV